MKNKRVKILWILSLLAITYLTLFYNSGETALLNIPNFDKVVHFIMFFSLSLLGGIHIIKTRNKKFLQWQTLNFIAASTLGGLIEVIQPYFGRECSLYDFYADSSGALFGALLSKFIYLKIIRKIIERKK